jgi:putative redox protein
MQTITLTHTGEAFHFDVKDENHHIIQMDTSDDHGGTNYGFRPMQSLLAALGGCSGIDIVSILQKQRISFTDLSMTISGEREKDVVPALWKQIHMSVFVRSNGDEETIQKALRLSIEKYCSVAETLRRAGCTITYELKLL